MKKNVWKSNLKRLWVFMLMLIVVLASSGFTAYAQEITGLIFEVEKDGKTSYIMGSIYRTRDEASFGEKIEAAYAKSDRIAVEVDATDYSTATYTSDAMRYSDGDTLDNHITQQNKEHIIQLLEEVGMNYDQIKDFKLGALISIMESIRYSALGYNYFSALDTAMINRARSDAKELYFLATVEDLENAFGFDEADEYFNEILPLIGDLSRFEELVNCLERACIDGDIEALKELNPVDVTWSPECEAFDKRLRWDRSTDMATKLDRLFQEEPTTFAVVEVMLLEGTQGILANLENLGYTVTQIK